MEKLQRFGPAILLLVFIAVFLYFERNNDERFLKKLQEIEDARVAIEDSVRVLKIRTIARDRELRDIIKRDLEIIDTLNLTLRKLNKSSEAIEQKIENNKKTIDELWKQN
jgi:hypothetical protein